MSTGAPANAVTFWSRFQLDTSDPTFKRAHQVQIHDPLWLLARQWQVGELTGFDGGYPVNAVYQLHQSRFTAYQPAPATVPAPQVEAVGANDPPLEVRVEREPFPLGLRGAVQLGLRFEAILRTTFNTANLASQIHTAISEYRSACAILATAPASEIQDPKALAFRQVVLGRVTDGWLLYRGATGLAPAIALPNVTPDPVRPFVKYCQSLYTLAPDTSAWDGTVLAFEFNAGVETSSPADDVGLAAGIFKAAAWTGTPLTTRNRCFALSCEERRLIVIYLRSEEFQRGLGGLRRRHKPLY